MEESVDSISIYNKPVMRGTSVMSFGSILGMYSMSAFGGVLNKGYVSMVDGDSFITSMSPLPLPGGTPLYHNGELLGVMVSSLLSYEKGYRFTHAITIQAIINAMST